MTAALLAAGVKHVLLAASASPAASPIASASPAAASPPVLTTPAATPLVTPITSPATAAPPIPVELPTFLLSSIIWIPLIAAAIMLLFPARTRQELERIRALATAAAALVLALAVIMWYGFREQGGSFAYEETRGWLNAVTSSYHLGVDGVSMPLVLLSSLLFFIAIVSSTGIRERLKEFLVLMLVLETALNGALSSLDFLLLFMFWGLQILPSFLLIAGWGRRRRARAAWKFLGFQVAALALLLVAILVTYYKSPTRTFDIVTLHDLNLPGTVSGLTFWLFFAAFAIQLPSFPFQGWLSDAVTESSTPISVVVAGVLVTLGGYGLYRVNVGEFPDQLHHFGTPIAALAVISVLWPVLMALREDDLKRLVSQVDLSRLGLVLLAVSTANPVALNGGILLMFGAGMAIAVFLLVAGSLAERAGTDSIRALGGLAIRMPRGATLGILAVLAALGLPGLVTFTAQFMVLVGSYPSQRWATTIAVLGPLLLAGLMFSTLQRIFFGPIREGLARVRDLGSLELTTTISLVSLMVLLGIFPFLLTDNINFGILTLLVRASP